MNTLIITTLSIFFGIIFLILVFGLKIINQYQRGVKFTLGKYSGIMNPGLNFIIPIIQTMERIDIRQTTIDLRPQEVMTKDQVNLKIDGVVFYHITNPSYVILNIQNLEKQISDKATSELKEVVGKMTMSEALQNREKIAKELKEQLDISINDYNKKEESKPWGIEIKSIQINNVELPQVLVRAMSKEAEAEREKKAIIIRASGEEEASQKYLEASNKYMKSPYALKLRELKTWEEIGKEHNSLMIVVPSELTKDAYSFSALGKSMINFTDKQNKLVKGGSK